jgi:histidine triad (HIT) family protein
MSSKSSSSCIFCSIIAGQQPGVPVHRESNVVVIMDGRLYSLVPVIAKAVVSAVKADGFNVGQNNGIAANQIVPHVHVHIVPRFINDSPDGKWPARAVASREELAKIANKIKQEITTLVPSA